MILMHSASAVQGTFYDLWFAASLFLPRVIAAIVVFLIAWVVGAILYRVVLEVIKVLRIDDALEATGVEEAAAEAGINLHAGRFLGALVMWFVVLVGLVSALQIIGLSAVTVFLQQIVFEYLPLVFVAALIIILTAIAADFVRNIVAGSARAAGVRHANLAGAIAKWAIWIFGILAALSELGIATAFVQTLYTGVVIALALAFGLSFGLGGKDAAADAIKKLKAEVKHELD